MHTRLPRGAALEHGRDHVGGISATISSQAAALSALGPAPDDAALQKVMTFSQMASAEITHLKTIPPPRHPVPNVGTENLISVARASLPFVTEADIGMRELSAAVARVTALYRAGRPVEAQAAAAELPRLRE